MTAETRYVWRNMMFRNLGSLRASDLIRAAVAATAQHWVDRYGQLPAEDLRTEIKLSAIRSEVPGYSYRRAGWVKVQKSPRGMLYLRCPRPQLERALRQVADVPQRPTPDAVQDCLFGLPVTSTPLWGTP